MSNDAEKQIEVLKALAQLQGVTKDSGFDYDKYLKKPIPRIALIWFVMSGAAFATVLLFLVLSGFSIIGFMFGIGCGGWVVFCVHQRWESNGGTTVSFFTAALLLLLASGLMTPKETAEQMKGYIQKTEQLDYVLET